ncbi:MFS transporter [Mangrovihabitans endophyticus]|uniref:MFS transporter n=1 Tax=Mangrovihabitans endophyticus TaxID=1751298 RepID=A0A8J3FMS4_9ACTN|nr:MFS transporter [Mangrovihabitans endophyticus]GGK75487.1 MFS transporter [Mangrovihabitans endophyticus]
MVVLATETGAVRRWVAFGSLCLALFVVTLDNTVLNVVLPTLVRRLGATSSELQWIVDAYVLVFAGLLLTAGGLADRVGRKRTYAAGMLVFLVGSGWAAYAGSVGVLIAARALMGAGAAFINPSTLSLTTAMFPDRRARQMAFGIWAATAGLGIALGPIVSGVLLAHFWWGSVFLVNVPIVLISLAIGLPLVPDSRDPDPRRTDIPGVVLSIVGLSLLLWAIIEAPGRGWTAPIVWLIGGAGVVVLAAFVAVEARSRQPMLDLRFFRSPRFSSGISTLALVMAGGGGGLFVVTQYLQFYLGYSPLRAGLALLPAASGIVVVAPFAGLLNRWAGAGVSLVGGLLVMSAGLWQFAHLSASSDYTDELPYLIMLGAGMGLVLPTATSSIMNALPSGRSGVGSATNSTFMQVGTALGVAVIGSLLAERYQDRLADAAAVAGLPAAVREAALGSVGGALSVASRLGAAGSPLAAAARSAFLSGLNLALIGAALVVAAATIVAASLAWAGKAGTDRSESPKETAPADEK